MENEEYSTRLELLYEIAREATSIPEISRLLERILRVTQQTIGASATSLFLIDEAGESIYFQVGHGETGTSLKQVSLSLDKGIAGWVARHADAVLVNNVDEDDRYDGGIDSVGDLPTESIIAVPLMRGRRTIGVLEAMNKTGDGRFSRRDLRVLKGFASTEALVLLVSMAETAIDNINGMTQDEAMLDWYRNTAEVWASAVDTKDPLAGSHSQRVKEYTLMAVDHLSLSPEERQVIEFGALFHDIGKIGIDADLLNKPGSLTEREWQIMQEHSEKGARIVGEIPFLEKAQDVVRYHHERYDGKGYPEGLRGEAIPLGARLVAVADAFDTMTTDRSYRPALGTEEAFKELIDGIGTQFCPVAVESFVVAFQKRGQGRLLAVEGLATPPEATDSPPEATDSPAEDTVPPEPPEAIADIPAELFRGDLRIVVPLTVGMKEVDRFKTLLADVPDLKIVLFGGSEEEGHLILVRLDTPMPLMRLIGEFPMVEEVVKHGKKGLQVTLRKG